MKSLILKDVLELGLIMIVFCGVMRDLGK